VLGSLEKASFVATPGTKVTETGVRELSEAGVAIETAFVSALVVLIEQSEIPEALEAEQLKV
jgi:ribosomal protein L12E/L44/L45/RPP1/RPP2